MCKTGELTDMPSHESCKLFGSITIIFFYHVHDANIHFTLVSKGFNKVIATFLSGEREAGVAKPGPPDSNCEGATTTPAEPSD